MAGLVTEIAAVTERPLPRLHRRAVDCFLEEMERLDDLVNRRIHEGATEVALTFRRIVDRVTVLPAPVGLLPEIEITGIWEH